MTSILKGYDPPEAGIERTRAMVRGLAIAYGLIAGALTQRGLTATECEQAEWAVWTAQQQAATLLRLQIEGDA